jgi:hypothetical protein
MSSKRRCDYCGRGDLPYDDVNAPCPECGAATNAVILANFTNGLQPMFRRTWWRRIKPGFWLHPSTGAREHMPAAEFRSLRSVE